MLQLSPNWKAIGLTVAALLLISLGMYGYQQWQGHRRTTKTDAAVKANGRARLTDVAARRGPDSTTAVLTGRRAENARRSNSLRRQDDSLSRLRRSLSLPAHPPVEQ